MRPDLQVTQLLTGAGILKIMEGLKASRRDAAPAITAERADWPVRCSNLSASTVYGVASRAGYRLFK